MPENSKLDSNSELYPPRRIIQRQLSKPGKCAAQAVERLAEVTCADIGNRGRKIGVVEKVVELGSKLDAERPLLKGESSEQREVVVPEPRSRKGSSAQGPDMVDSRLKQIWIEQLYAA